MVSNPIQYHSPKSQRHRGAIITLLFILLILLYRLHSLCPIEACLVFAWCPRRRGARSKKFGRAGPFRGRGILRDFQASFFHWRRLPLTWPVNDGARMTSYFGATVLGICRVYRRSVVDVTAFLPL